VSRGGQSIVPAQLDDIAEILISSEEIAAKVHELGRLVAETYQRSDLLLVSVLKGAVVFLSDLMRAIPIPLAIDFLAISGYGGRRHRWHGADPRIWSKTSVAAMYWWWRTLWIPG
jgi:hypoxanthine-guanine phosphoribosyltransferase